MPEKLIVHSCFETDGLSTSCLIQGDWLVPARAGFIPAQESLEAPRRPPEADKRGGGFQAELSDSVVMSSSSWGDTYGLTEIDGA